MRGYKIISLIAMIFYLFSFLIVNFLKINNANIENNKFLKIQLKNLNDNNGSSSILLLGSSGVLLGLSAHEIQRKTGLSTINLAIFNQGTHLNKYLDFVYNFQNTSRIVVIGDRDFRKSNYKEESRSKFLDDLRKLSFILNIRSIFLNPVSRTQAGDYINYQNNNFTIQSNHTFTGYSKNNILLMKYKIDSALKSGMCPVITYIPLLVYREDFQVHLAATENLNKLVKESGFEQYVTFTHMIETDKSLFSDPTHMSAKGREKWTRLISDEIIKRNMCGIGAAMELS